MRKLRILWTTLIACFYATIPIFAATEGWDIEELKVRVGGTAMLALVTGAVVWIGSLFKGAKDDEKEVNAEERSELIERVEEVKQDDTKEPADKIHVSIDSKDAVIEQEAQKKNEKKEDVHVPVEELIKLNELYQDGILSEEEFKNLKKELLDI